MSATLDLQRRQTKAFIAADTTVVTLIPTDVTVTTSGGRSKADGVPRVPQKFSLIPMSYDQQPRVTVDGIERIISYTLLGEWNCTMEVWDHWEGDDGGLYTVVAVVNGNGYEKKGLVECHLPVG